MSNDNTVPLLAHDDAEAAKKKGRSWKLLSSAILAFMFTGIVAAILVILDPTLALFAILGPVVGAAGGLSVILGSVWILSLISYAFFSNTVDEPNKRDKWTIVLMLPYIFLYPLFLVFDLMIGSFNKSRSDIGIALAGFLAAAVVIGLCLGVPLIPAAFSVFQSVVAISALASFFAWAFSSLARAIAARSNNQVSAEGVAEPEGKLSEKNDNDATQKIFTGVAFEKFLSWASDNPIKAFSLIFLFPVYLAIIVGNWMRGFQNPGRASLFGLGFATVFTGIGALVLYLVNPSWTIVAEIGTAFAGTLGLTATAAVPTLLILGTVFLLALVVGIAGKRNAKSKEGLRSGEDPKTPKQVIVGDLVTIVLAIPYVLLHPFFILWDLYAATTLPEGMGKLKLGWVISSVIGILVGTTLTVLCVTGIIPLASIAVLSLPQFIAATWIFVSFSAWASTIVSRSIWYLGENAFMASATGGPIAYGAESVDDKTLRTIRNAILIGNAVPPFVAKKIVPLFGNKKVKPGTAQPRTAQPNPQIAQLDSAAFVRKIVDSKEVTVSHEDLETMVHVPHLAAGSIKTALMIEVRNRDAVANKAGLIRLKEQVEFISTKCLSNEYLKSRLQEVCKSISSLLVTIQSYEDKAKREQKSADTESADLQLLLTQHIKEVDTDSEMGLEGIDTAAAIKAIATIFYEPVASEAKEEEPHFKKVGLTTYEGFIPEKLVKVLQETKGEFLKGFKIEVGDAPARLADEEDEDEDEDVVVEKERETLLQNDQESKSEAEQKTSIQPPKQTAPPQKAVYVVLESGKSFRIEGVAIPASATAGVLQTYPSSLENALSVATTSPPASSRSSLVGPNSFTANVGPLTNAEETPPPLAPSPLVDNDNSVVPR